MSVGSFKLLKLCSWFVSTECCNHATHNDSTWPLKDEIGNDQMMKYVGRNTHLAVQPPLLLQSIVSGGSPAVVFRGWAFEGSYHVRTLIGVDSTGCDLIVTLQLGVVGSSILAAEDHA